MVLRSTNTTKTQLNIPCECGRAVPVPPMITKGYEQTITLLMKRVEELQAALDIAEKVALGQDGNAQPSNLSQNCFCKKVEFWEVVYNGKLGNYSDLKGMGYIARLLAKPDEYISAIELSQNIVPLGKRKKESTPETETPINNLSVQEMVDETGLKECYKRLKEIPGEIERAKDTGDLAKHEDLAKERISILKYVKQSTFGTSTKTFDGDVGKARKAVGKAINTAIGKFETDNPELFCHLSSAIQQGMQCMYAPETPQNWVF